MSARAGAPIRDCDVVLKGGITSGVAYGGVLIALGREFRLRNIGGTSAGAIGAAIAAAAEYRRQSGGPTSFAELLQAPVYELATPGFMESLVQPEKEGRPALRAGLALMRQRRKPWRRGLTALRVLLASRWWAALAPLLAAGGATYAVLRADAPAAIVVALLVLLWLLALGLAVAVPVALVARATRRALEDAERGFGLCTGMPATGSDRPAITSWLHDTIQSIAGLPSREPLTFRHLAAHGIDLAMVTTDLGGARPVRLPLRPAHDYWFDPGELSLLFPPDVLTKLAGDDPDPKGDLHGLRRLPCLDLPVVVAVRMSLSVPLLFSSVPLHPGPEPTRARRSWFTDGGVTSNFPISLFDAWLPSRPTFGIDMRPFPLRGGSPDRRSGPRVSLPPAKGPVPPRWDDVDSVVTLVQQVVDAVQNWRDSAQAELDGFRDRVCVIRLGEGEGGLHLDMDATTLRQLVQDGREAGAMLSARFTPDGVQEHFGLRYRTLRGVLRRDLRPLDDPFGDLRMMLARWTRRNGHRPAGPAVPEDDAADMRIVPRL
jgi:predicted acylesterase/phospholipase RssA